MTGLKPNFPTFPGNVSPFKVTYLDQQIDPQDEGHVLQEWKTTITIGYDNATGVLDATGTCHRDPGSKWKWFVTFVGPGNEHRINLPVNDSVFNTSDLGVSTITQLNNASFTADK